MTDRLADEQIAEIEGRLDGCTGPWKLNMLGREVKKLGQFVYREFWGAVAVCPKDSPQFSNHERNMKFIAHAPTDIRALLDEVKRLRSAADSADMSGAAIMVCRKMLKDELGIHHAFFDDCVAHAIAMVKEGKTDD